jgi:hypothetical protein
MSRSTRFLLYSVTLAFCVAPSVWADPIPVANTSGDRVTATWVEPLAASSSVGTVDPSSLCRNESCFLKQCCSGLDVSISPAALPIDEADNSIDYRNAVWQSVNKWYMAGLVALVLAVFWGLTGLLVWNLFQTSDWMGPR